jgi:hypothetical protein
MTTASEVVDRQLDAYNQRDLDAFVACYAPDATVMQPSGSMLASGHQEIRERYGELLAGSPSLRAVILNRIEVGTVVIDDERVTGFVLPGMPSEIHAAVVYRVVDGLIQNVRLFA